MSLWCALFAFLAMSIPLYATALVFRARESDQDTANKHSALQWHKYVVFYYKRQSYCVLVLHSLATRWIRRTQNRTSTKRTTSAKKQRRHP